MRPAIAIGRRFVRCANVRSLGVKPNFCEYSPEEQALILGAPKIYDPTAFYAELFDTMGKPTFPNAHTYRFAQDKIKQTAYFQMRGIPHPRTQVFFGPKQKGRIEDLFSFPLIAKQPRGSALGEGVFLIRTKAALEQYLGAPHPAYIQEYLPIDRDIRAVVIGDQIAHAYWRIAPDDDFRTNLGVGGRIDLSPVPDTALELALHTARACQWDDVGIDICLYKDRYYVLEGNMKYGLEGFKAAGIDYHGLLVDMMNNGEI